MMNNIMEILDKLQFFCGQRAGRELWADKPTDVQDADLESYNENIEAIRDYIQQLEAEKDDMLETIKRMVICGTDCGGCMHFVEQPDKSCVELDFECEKCQDKCACYSCKDGSNYEWKGLAKKE